MNSAAQVNNAVLDIDQLSVRRGQRAILQDVSFQIEAGTDVAIIGPNGAGKSTLVQAILGILPCETGAVRLLGQSMNAQSKNVRSIGTRSKTTSRRTLAKIRQQVAYLPQNFLVDRRVPLTVNELVALGWDKLGFQWPWAQVKERQRAVRAALARVSAGHLARKFISELSGGETKRVLLAYCLVRSRQLLILDEAPAGLDVRGEANFYQLLYELKAEQGWTILQISHDLDMVRKHCDHVICLNRRVLCEGVPEMALRPENLSAAYGSEFVRYRHTHR